MSTETLPATDPTRSAPNSATAIRYDIQGLRALAVSLVVLYHLWPHRMTGGFIGVDVFFVISGFLITTHLLTHPPTQGRNLLQFWSRRIRRLLPAALLVLSSTLLVSRLVAPDTQWSSTAGDVKAASLYVINWRLAARSVNYLAANAAASPVEHFWSLSVEEQFYAVWPVFILLLVLLARRRNWPMLRVVGVGLALLVAASLAYSVRATDLQPASAYFITPTRMWELGIGGLIAVPALRARTVTGRRRRNTPADRAWLRIAVAWAGLAAIVWTAFVYTGSTPFPGYQALLPVLGTAAVIAASVPLSGPATPGLVFRLRPVRWLGDISYSVYLWHWPMIVLLPAVTGHALHRTDKVGIIAATLLIAWLSKRYVEDRFRTAKWGRPLIKPYVLAACAMSLVVVAAMVQVGEVNHREQQAAQALHRALSGSKACFGAAAMAAPAGKCPQHDSGTLTPSPLAAAQDKTDAYASVSGKKDCFAYIPNFRVVTCEFGDLKSDINVALVGNSHAGEWVSALERIAAQEHWKLTTYLASACANANILQIMGTPAENQACQDWSRRTTQLIAHGNYDLVIMTNRVSERAVGHDLDSSETIYAKGYLQVLKAFQAAHLKVVGIRDTPAPGVSTPDCLAAHPDDYSACNGTRKKWLPREPLTTAIDELNDPRITEVDLTDYICHPVVCPAEIGGVPVYFDPSHLTATFAATLAPYLAPHLVHALHGD